MARQKPVPAILRKISKPCRNAETKRQREGGTRYQEHQKQKKEGKKDQSGEGNEGDEQRA